MPDCGNSDTPAQASCRLGRRRPIPQRHAGRRPILQRHDGRRPAIHGFVGTPKALDGRPALAKTVRGVRRHEGEHGAEVSLSTRVGIISDAVKMGRFRLLCSVIVRRSVSRSIPSGDDINTLVTVMAGRLLVASRPFALQRPVGGWPGRPKRAPGHDGAWRVEVKAGWYKPTRSRDRRRYS